MIDSQHVLIRPVLQGDRQQINNLVAFGKHIHRHLDWRQPGDWIGSPPFMVVEWNYKILAALACPPDPEGIAWLRLFAVSSEISLEDAWSGLWSAVQKQLSGRSVMVAAIPMQRWFQDLLAAGQFLHSRDVVILQWDQQPLPSTKQTIPIRIRRMKSEDLPMVSAVDKAAFAPLWQNSQKLLEIALSKSAIATIAEISGNIVGYQISTANASNGHLARLAVVPSWQGRGVGYALVHNVLTQFQLWGSLRVTVNTQTDNLASLALYKKIGFHVTDEGYPIYHRKLIQDI